MSGKRTGGSHHGLLAEGGDSPTWVDWALLGQCYGAPFVLGTVLVLIHEAKAGPDPAAPLGTAYEQIGLLVLWHAATARFMLVGPGLGWAAFWTAAAVLTAPLLLLLRSPACNALYGGASLMFGCAKTWVMRSDPALLASRTTICARLTWCFWFQDLAKGRHVTDPTPALRAASARFWRVVVCVPLLAWAVLTHPPVSVGDAGVSLVDVAGQVIVRGGCGGFLFFFVLEFVDLIYLVPPLLLPASHSPRMVPVAMGAPFSSGSLAEFWGRRWDTAIQQVLVRLIRPPLVAMGGGAMALLLAVFAGSGALHVFLISLLGSDAQSCASMFAFFAAQAVLVAVERRVLTTRCRAGGGTNMATTVFMWTSLAVTAPLFVIPVLTLNSI